MSIGSIAYSVLTIILCICHIEGNCNNQISSNTLFYESDEVNAATKCPIAHDCKAWLDVGVTKSGVYPIQPDGQDAFQVYCDMETDGGGWTIFLRRQDGSVNFDRTWEDYTTGFGNLSNEFWLGLTKLHRLTPDGENSLRIDLGDFENNMAYAKYSGFEILDDIADFALVVKKYTGNAGDGLFTLMKFTTKDADNDIHNTANCANSHPGGWWFKKCFHGHLTARYIPGGRTDKDWDGINWYFWKGRRYSLRFAEMKLRRN